MMVGELRLVLDAVPSAPEQPAHVQLSLLAKQPHSRDYHYEIACIMCH